MPVKQLIQIEDKSILCVHGSDRKINEEIGIELTPNEIEELIERMDYDILLCGHTRSPYIVGFGGKLIMNVGSVGMPDDEQRASFGILDFDNNNFQYGIRKVKF